MISLRERMQADLVLAIKAGDRTRVSVLRTALAALANAEAVVDPHQSSTPAAFGTTEVPRRELDEAEVRRVLTEELDELRSTGDELRRRQRSTDADDLDAKRAILATYLDG